MSEWKSKPISRGCEVICTTNDRYCGRPTTHVYPALGSGYMALCLEHAKKHPEAWPMAEVDEEFVI